MARSNPNNANQYQLDPRQKLCWDLYVNPKSKTFGNALQSALKAGYERTSAEHITLQDWFLEKTRRLNMLSKAEKVLDEALELPRQVNKEGMIDSGLERVKTDVAKFLAERLGKNEGYTTKTETEHSGEVVVKPSGMEIK
jgi:hypothetical protein